MTNIYQQGLAKKSANFTALTPLNFIELAAAVYPDYPAVARFFNVGSCEWVNGLRLREPFTEKITPNVLDRFIR